MLPEHFEKPISRHQEYLSLSIENTGDKIVEQLKELNINLKDLNSTFKEIWAELNLIRINK